MSLTFLQMVSESLDCARINPSTPVYTRKQVYILVNGRLRGYTPEHAGKHPYTAVNGDRTLVNLWRGQLERQ
jgi:hypothetical protein